MMDQDLKGVIKGYIEQYERMRSNGKTDTISILHKLDSIVLSLETLHSCLYSEKFDLEMQLNELRQSITEVMRYEVADVELSRLIKHVVERTEIELIKLFR